MTESTVQQLPLSGPAEKFSRNEALLSGPAGGAVGIARSCYDEVEGTAIIGFDMVTIQRFSSDTCMF
jgi:hypothetical protein